jgi:23S rRNA (cytosine1962-C5)-methyltransferase
MEKFAPDFRFIRRLENLKEFASADEERSLKNLVFKNLVAKIS